jgi:hypothetical protein
MTDLVAVLDQLTKERAQLDRAITALSPVVGINSGKLSGKGSRRRKLSVPPEGESEQLSGHDGQRSGRRKQHRIRRNMGEMGHAVRA